MADSHRTTTTYPAEVWEEIKRELEKEQAAGNLPKWMSPARYGALLAERQLIAQREGRPRVPASELKSAQKPRYSKKPV